MEQKKEEIKKGNLCLGVKYEQSVFIGDDIKITVEKHSNSHSWVNLIIKAPKDIVILREKFVDTIDGDICK